MRRALGKGLAQLLQSSAPEPNERPEPMPRARKPAQARDGKPFEVPVGAVKPNTRQPRRRFDEEGLEELARSIREVGVLQPIVVRELGAGKYELIAGERRLRAAQRAGLKAVPAIVREAGEQASLEMALIENVQREDISPLECAQAFRRLADEFGLTQEQIANRVGKTRVAVSNTLRLLKLGEKALAALDTGKISEGHARALLMVGSPALADKLLAFIVERGLSVRQAEDLARRLDAEHLPGSAKPAAPPEDPNWRALAEGLSHHFGAPVRLHRGKSGGQLVVDFYSDDDLQRILDLLGVEL